MGSLSVLAKIDLYLLPMLLVASFLAALDKNSLAYAAVLGMSHDLDLHGNQYSWLSSIFYIGYLVMEFPTSWLLTRLPIGKYLGTSLMLWGGCLCFMSVCTSFKTAAAVRFFLGMLEAGLLPSCIVITACWYRREEQPLRAALWFGPFSGILGGTLAYAIGGINSDLPVWKLLFLIYGGCTIVVGAICVLALPDTHNDACFLTKPEREQAKLRTRENQTGESMRKTWKSGHIVEALKDGKYWAIVIFGIFQAVTNAGITNFSPLILSGFGYSQKITVLLAAPQGAVALVVQIVASVVTLYVPNIRCLLWILSCFPALAGVVMIKLVPVTENRVVPLMGLYLTGFYNTPYVLAMSLITSNTAGATKKSFISVSMAVSYAVGNMIGPQFFLDSQKPNYQLGIGAMIFSFAMMGACGAVYWAICLSQNRARDVPYRGFSPLLPPPTLSELNTGDAEEAAQDRTDMEIQSFRYTY